MKTLSLRLSLLLAALGQFTALGPSRSLGQTHCVSLSVTDTAQVAGREVTVPVLMQGNGNENALSFSLNFDTSLLTYQGEAAGAGAVGTALMVNSRGAATGTLGYALAKPARQRFGAGTNEILRVHFLLTNAVTNTPVSLTDAPVRREAADDSGNVLCLASSNGWVNITPLIPPFITGAPQGSTVPVGATVTLNVTNGGSPPFAYQWQYNGTALAGATNAALTLPNLALTQTGNYRVLVSNDGGTATSQWAVVQVLIPPSIVLQPRSQLVSTGETVVFTVAAAGSDPLLYQWKFNNGVLTNQTNMALVLTNLTLARAGSYTATVSNAVGTATSQAATLSVSADLRVVRVAGRNVATGGSVDVPIEMVGFGDENSVGLSLIFDPAHLTFAGVWAGSAALGGGFLVNSNQAGTGVIGLAVTRPGGQAFAAGVNQLAVVRFVGGDYPGAQDIGFTNRPVALELADAWGNPRPVSFRPGTINILSTPPVILADPADVTAPIFADAAFQVRAGGSVPLYYQWRRNGLDLAGASGATLSLSNVMPGLSGDYQVVVANAVGAVTSRVATLSVPRVVRVVETNAATGTELIVPVQLLADGSENSIGFSLAYDSARLTVLEALPGSGVPGAILNFNTNQAGRVGIGVALPAGQSVARGTQEVARMRFLAGSQPTTNLLGFTNAPAEQEVANLEGVSVLTQFQPGTLTTLLVPPNITSAPASQTAWVGTNLAFCASANGSKPMTYQWLWNGAEILGGTNACYGLPSVQAAQAGNYSVRISNAAGSTNSASALLTVLIPRPDLYISRVTGPANGVAGQPVALVWEIQNLGNAEAVGPWSDGVWLANDASGSGAQFIAPYGIADTIPAGGSLVVTNTVIVPTSVVGLNYFQVRTDASNQVTELNEANNLATTPQPIHVEGADLVVQKVSGPGQAQSGQTIPVSWSVLNAGAAPAEGSWSDHLYLSRTSNSLSGAVLLGTRSGLGMLAPGAAYTNSQSVTLPLDGQYTPDLYYLVAAADYYNSQPESNESNNFGATPLTLTAAPLPDLSVGQVIVPATALSGQPLPVIWWVTNQGSLRATGVWTEMLYWSNNASGLHELARVDLTNDLAVGLSLSRTQLVTLPHNGPAGPVWLGVEVDHFHEILEASETNNFTWSANPTLVPLTLALQAPVTQIAEDTPNPVLLGTVLRNGDLSAPLAVSLSSSDTNGLTVQPTVTIAAGQSTAVFELRVVHDGVVNSNKLVTLRASAAGFTEATVIITVLNTDLPRLYLTLATNLVAEGFTVPATVWRDVVITNPVTVFFQSSNPSQLSPPAMVTIPGGTNSWTFAILAVDDTLLEPITEYTITASAPGFVSASAALSVLDNDLPQVALALTSHTVSEGAGPMATYATVSRDPVTSRAASIELDNSNPTAALVPQRVVIQANQGSVTFPVSAVNNDLVDGPRVAVFTPYVLASGGGARLAQGQGDTLTVTDDDGPALTVVIRKKLVAEGLNPATTVAISRNTPATNDLRVMLVSSDLTEATLPTNAIIALGSNTVEVPLISLEDHITDGNQTVTVTASAPGYTDGSDTLVVSDTDLPDLVVAQITAPASAETESYVNVTYRVANQGLGAAASNFLTRVYLSRDPASGNDTLVAQYRFDAPLPVGQYFEQTLSVRLPLTAGAYWVVVETDAEHSMAEILEDNNTRISDRPIAVNAGYGAWVQTTLATAPAGTPVPMSGFATNQSGARVPFKLVNLHLLMRGTERIISALTDASGSFSTVWTPLANEAGRYELFATHPGVATVPVQATFTLLGLRANPDTISLALLEQSSRAGAIQLENLSDVPLTGLSVSVVSQPAGLDVAADLGTSSTLPGLGLLNLNYQLTANTADAYGMAQLRVSSLEGAQADIFFGVSVEPLRPRLVATPGSLTAGMARGRQSIVEFDLANLGGRETGPLILSTPNIPWLSVASTNPIPSLVPGQSNRITLLLTPAADLTLGAYTGNLALNSTNASLSVPFSFRALSEAKGDLLLTAVDELTYYAEGSPNLAGASVTVRDAVSQLVITNGLTGINGEFILGQIQEAYYDLEVTAEKHTTYRGTHLVLAGQTNAVQAFLSRQVVTYNWTVEPIEIEDRYKITIETTFETVVPLPVVTIEPSVIDLALITADVTQMEVKISNHGLIAANNTRLGWPTHPLWQFESIVNDIGTLPANSSITVPLTIRKLRPLGASARATAKGADLGPCHLAAYVCWQLVCGPETNTYCGTVTMPNARSGCGGSSTPPGGGGGCIGCGLGGGGGGTYVAGPNYSLPSLCDCNFLSGWCLRGEKSFDLDGIAKKLVSVLGKLVPPPLQLDDVSVSISVGGEVCTCCQDGHLGLEGNAHGSAEIKVVVLLGRGVSLPDGLELSAPGWADLSVEGSAMAGLRLTGTGTVELEYEKACLGDQRLCGRGTLTLNLFGGVDIEGTATAKFLADQLTYEGKISGQLGLEGEVSVSLEGCSDTGFKVTGCGEANARAHLTGELVTTTPHGDPVTNTIGPNGDVELLKRTCVSTGAKSARAPKAVKSPQLPDLGPLVEEVPGDTFFYSPSKMFRDLGIDPIQQAGICAHVKLRTEQEAVLTRDAFQATLEIDNADVARLEQVEVVLTIKDDSGAVVTNLFGFRAPGLVGLTAVDGSGILAGQSSGTVKWVIIPTVDAVPGPTSVRYFVSGSFSYAQGGTRISLPLAPVPITVLPSPRLVLKYFHQRDVFADDPFTEVVEPSIPFNLAVMVQNRGYGLAKNFRITSAQPQIVENQKGLLIDFQIIATEVAGRNLVPSLTADFGNIDPGQTAIGRWLMTSTLQGLFVDYQATFEHIDGLGNPKLSLIDEVTIHELIHLVQAGGSFEDSKPDFLVNDVPDSRDLPDTLYLSDGTTNPVSVVETAATSGAPTASHLQVHLTATMPDGWVYLRVPEPSDGRFQLVRVARADGTVLSLGANVWTTDRTFIGLGRRPTRENTLHLFDYQSSGDYTLTYASLAQPDTTPPTSQVAPLPPASAADIPVAWTGQDNDGGSGLAFFDIFVSVNRGPFQVWLPQTTLRSAVYTGVQGNTYSFYSVGTDRAGNREAAPAAPDAETSVTLSNQPPSIAALTEDSLDEGATASFTLAFTDPNLPNDRLNLRAIGAPTGLSLDATSGLIRWPTSEATGPSTNRFQVIVTDNGMPPLSATGEVVIVVREVNQPPSLWPIANRVVREMSLLLITNRASDADLPANILTFSLGAGAPTGASIDPVTGLFQWRPSELQGPSTNRIAVIVTDNGVPPLSATQTFIVVVRDTEPAFVLNLGTTNVFAGETNALPVILKSGLDLNRVTFEMTVPEERLTNWTLMLVAPEAVSGSGQRLGSGRFRIEILLNPEQAVSGSRTIAFLGFTAVPHARSIIVPVIPTSLAGYQATGPSLTNGAAWGGRVFVVATEPVLDLARTSNGFVNLFLYGTPGTTNRIQSTPSLEMPVWFVEWSNVLQGRMIAIPLAPTNSPARFFRAGSP